MSDFADDLFGELTEFYPGSKRKKPVAEAPPPPTPSASSWDRKPKVLTVKGVEQEFFTIGALAEAINRQPVTIRAWEDRGIMPKARFRGRGQKRLYTRRQIEGMVQLCARHGILDFVARPDSIPKEFTSDVIELWKEDL